ncbi:inorganic phosphate transporter [Micrococcus terreus]|uniref:inorganic phosphate transporter n=1 Tax=Micrococcus terreus TaxID=574650 RepID=UPI0033F9F630
MDPFVMVMLVITVLLLTAHGLVTGMRDAPNAVALPVRTRALTAPAALWLAAAMNLLGAVLAGGMVMVVTEGVLDLVPESSTGLMLLAVGLLVSTAWALGAWWKGMPISSTHALTTALGGAALALWITGDLDRVDHQLWDMVLLIVLALLISPLVAWLLAWLIVTPSVWISRNAAPGAVNHRARMTLALSGAANALGHGVQIGQRLGLLTSLALASAGLSAFEGWWIPVACGLVLAGGTLMGGWRIAHTLTERLVQLDPMRSAVASGVSAGLLFLGSFALHLPLSSTHTAVAAIVGAGQRQPYTAVRWPQVIRVVLYSLATVVVCFVVALILAAAFSPLI